MQSADLVRKEDPKNSVATGGKATTNPLQRKTFEEEDDPLHINPMQLKLPANNPLQLQALPIQFVRTSFGAKGGYSVNGISVFLNHHLAQPEQGEHFNPHVTTEVWYNFGPQIGFVRTYEDPGPAYNTNSAFTWKPEHLNNPRLNDLIGHIMSDHQQMVAQILNQNNNTFH